MKTRKPHFHYSMRVLLSVVITILVIVTLMCTIFFYSAKKTEMLEHTADSQSALLQSFKDTMSDSMKQVETFLYNAFYSNPDVQTLGHSTNDLERYRARESIASMLSQVVQLNDFIEVAWFYDPSIQWYSDALEEQGLFLARNNYTGITLSEIQFLKKRIITDLVNPKNSLFIQEKGWQLVSDEQHNSYLLWVSQSGSSYTGAWISISHLYEQLIGHSSDSSCIDLIICNSDGESLIQQGSYKPGPKNDTAFWEKDNDGNLRIWAFPDSMDIFFLKIVDSGVLSGNIVTEKGLLSVFLVVIFFVMAAFVLCQLLIYRPFQNLLTEMYRIRHYNPEERLRESSSFTDIAVLSHSINRMMDEISNLKQNAYESRIKSRDIQLQYLKIRLKVHFYLNNLSLIHAMARMGQTDLIQELTESLIEYMRFIDSDAERFVSLEKEMEHVRSYARIQKLRYPELFTYTENISLELYDAQIPPLILQTFMENSIDHGFSLDKHNELLISAHYEAHEAAPGILFMIEDNGKGFSEEELAEITSPAEPDYTSGKIHGIGIRNVISRINLLYENNAEIQFQNRPEGGALVTIWLPFIETDEEGEDAHV
ncbi:MAG: histidine kinase [Blautia sp.]|nr:histidine kinase [Blautia sp.]